jgi:molybdenum cofactor cytidylyltransferase
VTKDTYFLIVTRGHAADTEALRACIHSDAAYIGMIGSKRKVRLMRENFLANNWSDEVQFDRVHAPVGLNIESKTVQEIAVSICAEIIQERNAEKAHASGSFHGIILAAGASKRMGKPKMLLPFGFSTVIESVVIQSAMSDTDETIVVLGANANKIQDQLGDYAIKTVENKAWEDGMLTSVQAGINTLPEDASAALVMLGDQPMVNSEVINKVIEAYRKSEKSLLVATYNGKRGHPLMIGKKYFREILDFSTEKSLKDILGLYPDDIEDVAIEDDAILRDIDTEKDYEKELEHIKNI